MAKQRKLIAPRAYHDITQHEIQALKHKYNLADAHTHQSQSASQRQIVARLPKFWYEAERTKQFAMEQKFIREFFRIQKQHHALKPNNAMLVYAASIGMVIIANYLMKRKLSVALLEPCFDNIRDILGHMRIPVQPLKEEWLHEPEKIYDALKRNVTADAIFIVDPNNPTGFTLFSNNRRAYRELLRFVRDTKKLLIIDYCFASFMLPDINLDVFDVYELLERSKVSYLTIEDTGKTWPVQDAKVALIKTSRDLYEDIYNIHTSYLLNVSPFIMNFLTEYMRDSERDSFASVYRVLDTNRQLAIKALQGSILEFQEPRCKVSVAWFKIKDSNLTATKLQRAILQAGVYVLPGTYFYWSNHNRGERYIRIALARDPKMFAAAIRRVRRAVDSLIK